MGHPINTARAILARLKVSAVLGSGEQSFGVGDGGVSLAVLFGGRVSQACGFAGVASEESSEFCHHCDPAIADKAQSLQDGSQFARDRSSFVFIDLAVGPVGNTQVVRLRDWQAAFVRGSKNGSVFGFGGPLFSQLDRRKPTVRRPTVRREPLRRPSESPSCSGCLRALIRS